MNTIPCLANWLTPPMAASFGCTIGWHLVAGAELDTHGRRVMFGLGVGSLV